MQTLQTIGLGWAADALARMPPLEGSPYEDNNFCVLIQTPSCVYRFQKCIASRDLLLYAHQQYSEPHWQIVPDLAAHRLDKLVLLNKCTSWGDLLWLVHLLQLVQQDISTLLFKPHFYENGQREALLQQIKPFPYYVCLSRSKGYNLYIDTPLPDPKDKPYNAEYSTLPFCTSTSGSINLRSRTILFK